jgi:dienelactone hydrolase
VRRFEIALVLVIGLAVVLPVLFGHRLRRGVMALLLGGAVVLQLVGEGPRWQMIPAYLAAAGLIVGDLLIEERRIRGWPRLRRPLLGLPGVAALLVLPLALPMVAIPEPTGPFPVGTTTFELLDRGREEPYAGLRGRSRRIMVQVWYPAVLGEDDGVQQPWIDDLDVIGPALTREFGFPGFFLGYTRFASAHAHPDAEPVGGTVPVVVYSHGWRGFRSIALDQMESLASHGFMVIAIDHTHGSVATVFPNGTVAYLDPNALPDEEVVGEEAYDRAANLLIETYSEDQISVLDALELGPEGPFGRLAELADLALVGVYGHSTGGGAAVRTCILDERCVAVAGLDAWVDPISRRELAREVPVPSMYLRSDGWRGTPNDGLLRGLAERSPASSYWLGVDGASHNDFVLPPSFSPVATRLGVKGPIPSETMQRILDDYLVGFFRRNLFGFGGRVLDRPPPPEVDLEFIP